MAGLASRIREAGFTTLEVSMAMGVMGIGALAAASLLVSSLTLEAGNRGNLAAVSSVRNVVETVESTPFEEIFKRFNTDPADDPLGAGTAEGNEFYFVFGKSSKLERVLSPTGNAGTVFRVQIRFPTDAFGRLAEGTAPLTTGMPTDLNNDGAVVNGADTAGDYKVLPMRIRVSWQGPSGTEDMIFHRVLSRQNTSGQSSGTGTTITADQNMLDTVGTIAQDLNNMGNAAPMGFARMALLTASGMAKQGYNAMAADPPNWSTATNFLGSAAGTLEAAVSSSVLDDADVRPYIDRLRAYEGVTALR
ncbi:MAG TPA: hypothetical protein ENK43_14815 [Planctomycetes bacterium]|nr:hypothetical protein [Planctomycetota bacterium]